MSDAEEDNSSENGGPQHRSRDETDAVDVEDYDDDGEDDRNSEEIINLDPHERNHQIKTASTVKDGRRGRVLQTENAIDDLDLFQEERTPE